MSIGVPHVGHTAAWEYIEKDSILRIKQFRQTDDGIVANFLHLQVSGPEEAASKSLTIALKSVGWRNRWMAA